MSPAPGTPAAATNIDQEVNHLRFLIFAFFFSIKNNFADISSVCARVFVFQSAPPTPQPVDASGDSTQDTGKLTFILSSSKKIKSLKL